MTQQLSIYQRARQLAARLPLAPGKRFARSLSLDSRWDLVRIGSEYGGWSVPKELIEEDWVCYCAGVGNDVTFDLGLIERYGCSVFAFDPTPSSARHIAGLEISDPRFHFVPVGVWSSDTSLRFFEPDWGDSNYSAVNLHGSSEYFEAPVRSLPSLMAQLGHTRIDLLKLDVEGAEYEALKPILDGTLRPTVLCVELHKVDGLRMHYGTVRGLKRVGYEPICLEKYDLTFVHLSAQPQPVGSAARPATPRDASASS